MNIVILGFGTSGEFFFNELIQNGFDTHHLNIYLVDKKINEKCIFNPSHINDNINVVYLKKFHDLLQLEINLLILSLPPFLMPAIIDELDNYRIGSLIIEKPGPFPFLPSYNKLMLLRQKMSIFVNHQRQYSDHFKWVHNQIKKGIIGEIDVAILTLEKWDFLTAGTHWLAFTHLCFGLPSIVYCNVQYSSKKSVKYKYPIEDSALFSIRHHSNIEVIWRINTMNERSDLRILGKSGYIDLKFEEKFLSKIVTEHKILTYNEYGKPFKNICMAALNHEVPKAGCSLEDLANYLVTYCCINKSAIQRRPIYINEVPIAEFDNLIN